MGSSSVTSFSHIPNTLSSTASGVLGRALAPGHSVTGTCLAKSCFKHICCAHTCSPFFPVSPPWKLTWVGQFFEDVHPLNTMQRPDLKFATWALSTISDEPPTAHTIMHGMCSYHMQDSPLGWAEALYYITKHYHWRWNQNQEGGKQCLLYHKTGKISYVKLL